MAMDAFVPLTMDSGRRNDGTGARPPGRTARPARPMLRAVKTSEKATEDPKFRFWPNNRGDNLSKRVKNRTGRGENGTSKLCPRRRGKLEVPGDWDQGSGRPARISSSGGARESPLAPSRPRPVEWRKFDRPGWPPDPAAPGKPAPAPPRAEV